MLDGAGAASEPNIFEAIPALSVYLGRLARAENNSDSDIEGSPPVQRGNVSLTNVQVLNAT